MKFSLLLVAFMALANCTLVFCQDEFPPFGFEFNVAALKIMRAFKCADPKGYWEPPDGGAAIAIDFKEPVFDPQVDVSIAPVGGHTVEGSTAVEALLTNNAMMSIDVFRPGSILDMRTISKANVYYAANNSEVPFQGVEVFTNRNVTTDKDWITIPVGQCKSAQFDVADSYDLSAGGDYYYQIDTHTLARHSKQHDLEKSVRLVSNRLLVKDVDGAKAAQGLAAQAKYSDLAKTDFFIARQRCLVEQQDILKQAQKWAKRMAIDGAWHALISDEGSMSSDWFIHFYHTTSAQARCYVVDMLIKFAEKLHSDNRYRRIDCIDRLQMCNPTTMGYSEVRPGTQWVQVIHICPAAFTTLFEHTPRAGDFDMAMMLFTKTVTLPVYGGEAPVRGQAQRSFLSEDVNGLPMAALLPWEVASRNAETWTYYIQWAHLLPNYPPA